MSAPFLSFAEVSVGYRGTPVVESASFEVRPGEVVGLIGPNGAGKSTLLKAITGDSRLFGGRIEIAGQALESIGARDRARLVGVVPQQVVAAFAFPAIEFVEMGRHPHVVRFGSPGPQDAQAVERAMRLTATTHLAEKPIDALSGGDLQRLAFAQALAQEPKLLLLDEPTSHLDLNHRLQILDLMRELADGGMAVLAVFHDLDLAARYADRIGIVCDGSVIAPAPPAEVITAAVLRDVFGVRAVVGTDPITGAVSVTPVLRDSAVAAGQRGRVLVIGGAGSAAPLMRRLVLAGWEVLSGALNAGDADALVAEALGVRFAELAPFAPMDAEAEARVTAFASEADAIVVCEVPFGHGNVGNLRALAGSDRPLVLVGSIEGRDFTGGAAEELWTGFLERGAITVTAEQAEAAVAAAVESAVATSPKGAR